MVISTIYNSFGLINHLPFIFKNVSKLQIFYGKTGNFNLKTSSNNLFSYTFFSELMNFIQSYAIFCHIEKKFNI